MAHYFCSRNKGISHTPERTFTGLPFKLPYLPVGLRERNILSIKVVGKLFCLERSSVYYDLEVPLIFWLFPGGGVTPRTVLEAHPGIREGRSLGV